MRSVCRHSLLMQGKSVLVAVILFSASLVHAGETAKEMKSYTEKIANTEVSFDMVPIPGGEYTMGSPATEKNRADDEGPQLKSKLNRFGWANTK